mmetsp:Transcript_47011/g.54190  ORF Transcript_47011/g.54190 Transcript_47011/m.54190 type:complete len:203 (-) Transcript_47011:58-666(-)|eukprot:CAMPEP_0114997128 /NCGR_PEP_ID=MMETSP0216-20121206/14723_1 /TAXON_ID=223996 /ORGANISM="Protocruzia adherens, Strain Boccale" /LENGTH=202 /DNA_ID=CAMNT_0002361467 /DNA_START=37 /DNA_END=645 /DNA_ORIENTATION=-
MAKVSSTSKSKQPEPPAPINKYDPYSAKFAIDEAIIEYMDKNGFQQSTSASNLKILWGFIGCLATGISYYSIYHSGTKWPENRVLVIASILTYIAISILLYATESFMIKDAVYISRSRKTEDSKWKHFKHIRVSSIMKEYDENYHLTISAERYKDDIEVEECYQDSIGSFFDSDGVLHKEVVEATFDAYLKQFFTKAIKNQN